MVIIAKRALTEFAHIDTRASKSLNKWYDVAKSANWNCLSDIKKDFNNVDYVGGERYVFNIKGNLFRLVTMIFFDKRTVYIRFIGTREQYDQVDCSKI